MKKLFTMMAVCAATFATFTASAGSPFHAGKTLASQITIPQTFGPSNSNQRAVACDTVLNIAPTDNSVGVYDWQSPAVGFVAGSGALPQGSSFFPILGLGEYFTVPISAGHVTSAVVGFGVATINPTHADSIKVVTAYVYDATGTGGAPGHALDSASVTLGQIATNITDTLFTLFNFTNQPTLPAGGFFIVIPLPQVTGDSLAVASSGGATGIGRGWLDITSGGWLSYTQILSGDSAVDDFIEVSVCGTACPTITVTPRQLTTTSADASASGGVSPYTYAWSNQQTTDTATGLTVHDTYTVTATDHNGCSGTATISISTGIASIGDITTFSIYPNPSNGAFTASIHLEAASDVVTTISDLTGNQIYQSTDNAVKDLNKQINLGTISAGIYFVNVKTALGTANQRIVVK